MAGETGSGFPVFKTEGGAFDRAKFNADLQASMGANINPETADALKEAGVEVLGMVAIFTYGFEIAAENFKNHGIPLYTLSDYNALIEEAVKLDYVTETQLLTLQDWRISPSTWRK